MLNLEKIVNTYSDNLRPFKKNILKEYLQYKILKIIFESKYFDKLVFIGGTALRIVHGNARFSEDLDFDNKGLNCSDFHDLSRIIKHNLELEGLKVDITVKTKNAYRIKIRIPEILFNSGLSPMLEQKIMLQIDTVPQNFEYKADTVILNKFDVFTTIKVAPLDLLLAQKFYACTNRNRIMGRDFFDIIFLISLGSKVNYAYLKKNISIENKADLKKYIKNQTKHLDFDNLAQDLEPFFFDSSDISKVKLFPHFLENF